LFWLCLLVCFVCVLVVFFLVFFVCFVWFFCWCVQPQFCIVFLFFFRPDASTPQFTGKASVLSPFFLSVFCSCTSGLMKQDPQSSLLQCWYPLSSFSSFFPLVQITFFHFRFLPPKFLSSDHILCKNSCHTCYLVAHTQNRRLSFFESPPPFYLSVYFLN